MGRNLDFLGALGNVGGDFLHFAVDAAVGGEERGIAGTVGAAGEIADGAAGFFHHEDACSGVPGSQAEFPESVEAAAGDGAKVERGGAVATDTM